MIQLTVNGEAMQLGQGNTLIDLLNTLEMGAQRIAVEINQVIIPRSQHPQTQLNDGDQVEIVRAIGGG